MEPVGNDLVLGESRKSINYPWCQEEGEWAEHAKTQRGAAILSKAPKPKL